MLTDNDLLQSELQIDSVAREHLKEISGWAKFLGVCGFILSGLLALVALFAGTLFSQFTSQLRGTAQGTMVGGFLMVFYLIIAAILFFMSLFLFRFATRMQEALKTNDQDTLNISLKNLKMYYRFAGIITIIYVAVLFFALIGGIIAAMVTR